jgi:Tfp pilus assembly protein PilF
MNKTDINNIHKQIVKAVYSGRLYDAIVAIKNQNVINENDSSSPLMMVEQTYKFMLKYSVEGMKDPNRDKIFCQLQVSLLMLADGVRNYLLKKNNCSAILSNNVFLQPSEKPNNSNSIDWFNYLIHNEELGNDSEAMITSAKDSDQISVENLSLIVSALTLSLLLFFDIKKFRLLTLLYLTNQEQIWQRALVGIFVVTYFYNKRFKLYSETPQLFQQLIDSKDFKERYHNVVIQFIKAINTDKITKIINDEILPTVSKISSGLKDKMISDSSNIESWDETNPDWGDFFEKDPELLDKMAEVSKLQLEGSDVFINTFSMLKSFSFFNRLENWFYPFTSQHPEIQGLLNNFKDTNFNFKKFVDGLEGAPFICNSDKYSFCLSVSLMPESQRGTMGKLFTGELGEMNKIRREDELLHKPEFGYKIMTQYVQDLYRFFKISRIGKDFVDIFDKSLSPIGTLLFDKVLDTVAEKRKIGEYFFKNENFRQAFDIFERISTEDPNFEIFQKMGYSAQKFGDIQKALDCFNKAQLFDDKQIWNLKKIGSCYRKLGQPLKALEFYRKAESQDPDNLSIATAIGRCLLETENYDEALKYYFKVEYLDEKNTKVFRPIAWCSYELQKFEQALKYTNKIPQADKEAEDYVLAGHICRKIGKNIDAMNYYLQALDCEDYTIQKLEDAMKTDYNKDNSADELSDTALILDYLMFRKNNQID